MADNCRNGARAQAIRDLARKVKATADKFEATRSGAPQEHLAETLRHDLAVLEQTMRTAVAAAMTDAALDESVVVHMVEHASQPTVSETQWLSEKESVRRLTVVLTSAARSASAMSDDPRRVQLVRATTEQLERCSDQVGVGGGKRRGQGKGCWLTRFGGSFCFQLLAAADVVKSKPTDEAAKAHMSLLRGA